MSKKPLFKVDRAQVVAPELDILEPKKGKFKRSG